MDDKIVEDAVNAITNSIKSGHNVCGTLAKDIQSGSFEFTKSCIRPTLRGLYEQMDTLVAQYHNESEKNNKMRYALEYILANVPINNPDIEKTALAALGRGQ